MERASLQEQHSAEDVGGKSTTDTDGDSAHKDQAAQDEFKFTIDADDEEVDDEETFSGPDQEEPSPEKAEEELAQEQFVDSDDDVDATQPTPVSASETPQGCQLLIEEEKSESSSTAKDSVTESRESGNNPYAKENLPMEKGHYVFLRDFELLQARKEVKNPSALRSMVSQVREERLLTICNGVLFSFKRVPSKNIAAKSLSRFFAQKLPESQQEMLAQEDRGLIKGKSELSRLYKIDVVGKGRALLSSFQTEMQLILHFVNKNLKPTGMPDLKRYVLRADDPSTKQFLAKL